MLGRYALCYAAQQENDFATGPTHPFPERVGEQVEDRSTYSAAVVEYGSAVFVVGSLLIRQFMSVGTVQSLRMQMLQQKGIAALFVQEFVNRKEEHGILLFRSQPVDTNILHQNRAGRSQHLQAIMSQKNKVGKIG